MKIGNLECYGIIYKIENLTNGKVYIGQTTRNKGLFDRYHGNLNNMPIEWIYNYHVNNKNKNESYNGHLVRAIEKYGFNNFKVIEFFDIAFSKEELDLKEKCWIKIYNSTNPNHGYNMCEGGSNGKRNKESLINMYRKNSYPVYCENDNKIFLSISEVEKYYNIRQGNLGIHLHGNTKYIWITINNKKEKYKFIILDYYKNHKSIINLETLIIYKNFSQAEKFTKISRNTIKSSIYITKKIKKGRYFMYVNDFYDKLKNVISNERKEFIFNKFYEIK